MAHIHYSDGYSYGPTEFGSTDSTTGQWKIKTEPSISYGSEGYFMFKNDASINDQSGNGNNFTAGAGGAPTPTVDSPSNVFATFNTLDNYHALVLLQTVILNTLVCPVNMILQFLL